MEEWKAQYNVMLPRYNFLVLAGPSRMGKTAFARSLAAEGMHTLEVNCASGAEPDMRAYRLATHDCVLFDEVHGSQVLAQKKLFQCSFIPVELGCSATNCHSYKVFVHRKKFVLCTNNWSVDLAHMLHAEVEWLLVNSFVLEVTSPMWVE